MFKVKLAGIRCRRLIQIFILTILLVFSLFEVALTQDSLSPEPIIQVKAAIPKIYVNLYYFWTPIRIFWTMGALLLVTMTALVAWRACSVAKLNQQLVRNIRRRQQSEMALQETELKFRAIFNQTFQFIGLLSTDGILLEVNQAALDLAGLKREKVVGQLFWETPWWTHSAEEQERLKAAIGKAARGKFVRFEATHLDVDNRLVTVDFSLKPVKDESGQVVLLIPEGRDITAIKQAEAQLRHDALHDSLTGLANRALLMDRLEQEFKRQQRHPDCLFGLIFLDLDRFKVINDSLGHLVGDQLLIDLARRLEKCKRASDTISRLGGDEFIILLKEIRSQDEAIKVAERIHRALEKLFIIEGHELFVSASMGIAFSSPRYDQPAQLLRDADTALYEAKKRGKSCHSVFDPSMHSRALKQLQLESELRRAINRQELVVYYQPIVSLETNCLQGVEALVRWQHPELVGLAPCEFIPIAEETGLILSLDQWVLRDACRQLCRWQEQFPASSSLTLSVNLSGKQFSQPDFPQQIDEILTSTGLEGQYLKLEITESTLIENSSSAAEILRQLRDRKIQVCIDDFGTGYSSLSYLHRFPLNILKIDRSFVSSIGVKCSKPAIVRTIVTMGHELGMGLIAEGVETDEQMAFLKALGCHYGQGYLFSPPVDNETMTTLLDSQSNQPII